MPDDQYDVLYEEYDDSYMLDKNEYNGHKRSEEESSIEPPLPECIEYPVIPVMTFRGKAAIYAFPKGYRVVGRRRETRYRKEGKLRTPRWRLFRKRFLSYQKAFEFADKYVQDVFHGYNHGEGASKRRRTSLTSTTGGPVSDRSTLPSDLMRYGEAQYVVYWEEYQRNKMGGKYPGDYESDFAYWYNKGFIRAMLHRSQCVPSWCMKSDHGYTQVLKGKVKTRTPKEELNASSPYHVANW